MPFNLEYRTRIFYFIIFLFTTAISGFSGVARDIQEQYKIAYENKVMFLKIPVYSEQQSIYISGQSYRVEQYNRTPIYNVGAQLRVFEVDFGGDEIKFKLGEIAGSNSLEIEFNGKRSL